MPAQPVVTILMPVYNAAEHLAEALDSMIAQTLRDFELLIIDDGSTDATAQMIGQYAQRDARVRPVHNAANRGLTSCLNQGLALARGVYIARMDGDDISLPDRLRRQVAFLDASPRVGVCGTWLQTIGEFGSRIERYPTAHADIVCQLLFRDVLAHPTVMLRRALLDECDLAYDPSFRQTQDYDLWVRAAEHAELANLPQVLLHYRMHRQQVGRRQLEAQDAAAARVRLAQLQQLGLRPGGAEQALHEALSTSRFQPARGLIDGAERWLRQILAANHASRRYDQAALERTAGARWYTLCRLSTELGLWVWWRFIRSPLRRGAAVDRLRLGKFALKSVLRSPSL